MSEIPGKDNYQGNIIDEAFDLPAQTVHPKQTGTLNAAYYHRLFKVMGRDAMGQSIRHRGYSDARSRSVCLKCPMKLTSYKTQEFRLKSDERWESILILLQTNKISFFSIALCQRTLKCQQPLQQTNGTLFKPTHCS